MALTDEAILRIKEMILGGQLKPGDRLPREADLAETLGLSRNSLREAVRALALINILDVRQGDGTYVTSLDPNLLLDTLTFVVDFHRDDTVLDFLRVRRILSRLLPPWPLSWSRPSRCERCRRSSTPPVSTRHRRTC